MNSTDLSVSEFTRDLASASPAPGGGGAAAISAAMAAALTAMASGLTAENRRFAQLKEELSSLSDRCRTLSRQMLLGIDRDAEAFLPLAEVFRSDRSQPDYFQRRDRAALAACQAPQEMLDLCTELGGLLEQAAENCSATLLSDIGCAAILCKAAVQCLALNIYVNLSLLSEGAGGPALRQAAEDRVKSLSERMDRILGPVCEHLKGKVK